MMRRVSALGLAGAAMLWSILTGCENLNLGSVTGADVTPEKNGFSELEFGKDPTLAAQLHHYVMVHLEPNGTHESDTGGEGYDEIPYELKTETTLALGIPGRENFSHWLELCNEKGDVLAFAKRNQATSSVTLEPGRYKVRVHHAGGSDGEPRTLFLRSNAAKSSGAAQRRVYTPSRYGDDELDDIFCIESDGNGFGDLHSEYNDSSLFLSGDLSCAEIHGMDFSPPRSYYYSGFILSFGRDARGIKFSNCNFNDTAIAESVADAQFINCTMVNVDWDYAKLTGASLLQNCDMRSAVDLLLDMSGITITGCNFNGGKLKNARFDGAAIRNCDFGGAIFDGASISTNTGMFQPAAGNTFANATFAGVTARSIDFTGILLTSLGTNWSRADLTACKIANQTLTTVNFTGATFTDAILDGSICQNNTTLAGNNFAGASLQSADFTGSNFTHATLDRAEGVAANFSNCTLDNISAHGASFAYSNFSNATFAAAQLGGAADSGSQPAAFTFAYMPNVRITDQADFRNVDFSHAHLYGPNASVQTAELTAANFTGAIISGMDFSGATLESCSFEDAQCVGTKFISARLNDAKFVGAYLMGADFTNAVATSVVFADAAVSTAPCSNAGSCSHCADAACKFTDLNPANLCCYSFSEPDGTVYAVSFGATVLPADTSIVCPNGELGPCSGAKLTPRAEGPYPPVPACVPTLLNWCPQPTNN